MSDHSHEHAPKRVLRRAANLLNPTVSEHLPFHASPGQPVRRTSLTNSIKRKWSHVKRVSVQLTRSKSHPIPTITVVHEDEASQPLPKRKGRASHARSHSVVDSRPPFLGISTPNHASQPGAHRRYSLPPSYHRPQYPSLPSYDMTDVSVPLLLQHGTPMTKVSSKRQKKFLFRVDPEQGQIVYESSRTKISTSMSKPLYALNYRPHRRPFSSLNRVHQRDAIWSRCQLLLQPVPAT
jgi:phosphatidylinositol phospholipase C, delta